MADMAQDQVVDRPLKVIENRIPKGMWATADIGVGWHDLVLELDRKLAEIDPDYVVHQVKEKFGSLRFYAQRSEKRPFDRPFTEDPFFLLIQEAESKSEQICEDCGKPGQLRRGGWLRTLCDEHAAGRETIPPLTAQAAGMLRLSEDRNNEEG